MQLLCYNICSHCHFFLERRVVILTCIICNSYFLLFIVRKFPRQDIFCEFMRWRNYFALHGFLLSWIRRWIILSFSNNGKNFSLTNRNARACGRQSDITLEDFSHPTFFREEHTFNFAKPLTSLASLRNMQRLFWTMKTTLEKSILPLRMDKDATENRDTTI